MNPERQLDRIRKKFGMVYQYAALLDSITVHDNIAFPLVEHTKLSKKEITERVLDKLEVPGLDPKRVVARKFPSELSGGTRKRVGLARALMLESPNLVHDELTSGLDPNNEPPCRRSHRVDARTLQGHEHLISHDIASCFRIAHQAALLIKGKVEAYGPGFAPQRFERCRPRVHPKQRGRCRRVDARDHEHTVGRQAGARGSSQGRRI